MCTKATKKNAYFGDWTFKKKTLTIITKRSLQSFGRVCRQVSGTFFSCFTGSWRTFSAKSTVSWIDHGACYNLCRGKTMESRIVSWKGMIHKWSFYYCSISLPNGNVFAMCKSAGTESRRWSFMMSSLRLLWWPWTLLVLVSPCRSYSEPTCHFISKTYASRWHANDPHVHMQTHYKTLVGFQPNIAIRKAADISHRPVSSKMFRRFASVHVEEHCNCSRLPAGERRSPGTES